MSWLVRLVRCLLHTVKWMFQSLKRAWQSWTGPVLTLESGLQVRVGPQLAEGGFSFVYLATRVDDDDDATNAARSQQQQQPREYALKRIFVGGDQEIRQACLKEAEVHHATHNSHPHLMPLLGFLNTPEYCYMLFPLCQHSLRHEVNQRTGLMTEPGDNDNSSLRGAITTTNAGTTTAPWPSEVQVLQLFYQIASAVHALHEVRYAHNDIKLENILLQQPNKGQSSSLHPLLMDFGSAGPTTVALPTRSDVLQVVERAAQHTTLPYRPPELLEGTVRHGANVVLDYKAVDVWSLGCTYWAILYGASPMECDFRSNSSGSGGCAIRIVECTTLRILNGNVPQPPPQSPASSWYAKDLVQDLIPHMLQQDPTKRPTLPHVLQQLETLLHARGGTVPESCRSLLSSSSRTKATLLSRQGSHDCGDDHVEFAPFVSSSANV